jgi:O-methyltransferase domain
LLDQQIALANRRFPFCFAALRPEADIDFRVTYREAVERHIWEPLRQLRIYVQAVIGCVRLKAKNRLHEMKYASGRPGLWHIGATYAPSLRRLLHFLTSLGVFAEDAAGRYGQTALSDTLRSDHPQSFRGGAILFGSEFLWRPWAVLRKTVATGKPAFDHVFGATFFNYLAAHPDDAAIFNAGMTSSSSVDLAGLLAVYDFSGFERIVDVGGGQGMLLHGILSANPQVRGVLFDLPSVVAGATALRTGVDSQRLSVRPYRSLATSWVVLVLPLIETGVKSCVTTTCEDASRDFKSDA